MNCCQSLNKLTQSSLIIARNSKAVVAKFPHFTFKFCISGRKFSDKKKIFQQPKI